jgi:hypothetical protein
MFMKKGFKRSVAVLLVLLLSVFSATMALAGDGDSSEVTVGGTIDDEVTVVNPIISVAVPTTLFIALDPYGLSSAGQVSNPHKQAIFNRSAAPVKVTFDLVLDLSGGDATYQNDYSALDLVNPDAAVKAINLGLVGATALAPASSTFTTTQVTFAGDTVAYAHDPEDPEDNYVPFYNDGTEIKASIAFALAKAIYTDSSGNNTLGDTGDTLSAMASGNTGGASFAFYGAISTKADSQWAATDVAISGAYTIAPYLPAVYTDVIANGMTTTGVNQLTSSSSSLIPVMTTAGPNAISASLTGWTNLTSSLDFKLSGNPATVTTVTRPDMNHTYTSAQYAYNSGTGVFSLKQLPNSQTTFNVVIATSAGTYTIAVTTTS